jgi:DNA-binding SARP family transcriptional activator/tetratricopeptide (TPR) repeat protein
MLHLYSLGALALQSPGEPVLSSRRKELVLLVYLARRGPRPLSRAEAAGLLWDARDGRRAHQSLRQALLELRRLVGEGLQVDRETVTLREGTVELDAARFERDVMDGRPEEGVGLWKGDFLAGAEDLGGEEFRIWLEAEREALRRRLQAGLARLIADADRRNAKTEMVAWAERWTAALPLDEEGGAHLLRALHAVGRYREGLAYYEGLRTRLRSELEAEPGPAVEELVRLLERSAESASSPGRSSAALFTPDLVGRGPLMADLTTIWESVQRGRSGVVVIEGDPGVGKSRLSEEFLRRVAATTQPGIPVWVRARELPPSVEHGSLRKLIAGLASAPGLAGAPTSALQALLRFAPELAERFPALPAGAGTGDVEAALFEALAAVAEGTPLLLFVDDLPDCDPATRRVLLHLAERLPSRVLFLVTARTGALESSFTLPAAPESRRLKLQPLTLDEVDLLLGSMLELAPEDRRKLAVRLHQHAGGNPFYIVELVSALASEGTLVPGDRGTWKLADPEGQLPLPSSIREAVAHRLERLTPSAHVVLETAAVLGTPFDRELIAETAEVSPVVVENGIDELLLAHLIQRTREPGVRYGFAHEVARRHLNQTIPPERGEALSRRAIAVLERREGKDPAVHAALAYHRARVSAPTAERRWRRVVLGAALAVAAALVLGITLWRARPAAPGPASTVAVLPFPVSATGDLSYLSEGIVTLLSTQLQGVGSIRSVDPRAVLGVSSQVTGDGLPARRGSQVAQRVGAGTFVVGSIVEAGGRIRIDATVYRTGAPQRALAEANVEGPTDRLFDLVDNLAGRLLTALNPGPYEQLTKIAATTTGSLRALRAYLEGERLFREGEFHRAARSFQDAATEDTTFALAYYWLSVASWWADDSKAIDSAAAQAVRYSGRLGERDRRLFQAWEAFLRGDALEAERVYRQVVGTEPENVEAWLQLGEVLFHSGPRRGRPLADARRPFERVLFYEPEHTSALLHLARIAASEGRWNAVDSLGRRIEQLGPSGEWALELRALRAFGSETGSRAERTAVIAELRTAGEGRVWNIARYVAVAGGGLGGAGELVRLLTAPTRPAEVRAFGYLGLAHLELAQGRLATARADMDSASRLDPVPALEHRALLDLLPFVPATPAALSSLRDSLSRWRAARTSPVIETSHLADLHEGVHPELKAYLLGSLSVRMRDTVSARRYVADLDRPRTVRAAATVAGDAAGSIRAQLDLLAGRPSDAAVALEEVLRLEARVGLIGGSPFYSQGLERFRYAEALERLGRLDEALSWYGSFSSNSIFDLVYLVPSHLHRARIAERLGHRDEAVRHYQRVVTLWQDGDPELQPLVEEARGRLGELSASSQS